MTISQGIFRRAFDIGDVSITDQGGQAHKCDKVSGLKDFVDALNGRFPSHQSHEVPWYSGLGDADLESFEVVIPAISNAMFNMMYETKFVDSGYPTGEIPNGGWVRSGQVISRYSKHGDRRNLSKPRNWFELILNEVMASNSTNTTDVIPPISGKITWSGTVGNGIMWSDSTCAPDRSTFSDKLWFARIRPIKGQTVPQFSADIAYRHIIAFCESFLADPEFLASLRYVRAEQLAADLRMVRGHRTACEPVIPKG
jgi:hypothetical protein